jgi:ubiquitin carboxyl-terminal hydrolase 7
VVKRTGKRVSDSPITAVKMKVLEVESDIFVDLFLSRNRNEAKQYQGLINQGNTCYMNSYLQMLFHLNCLRHMVFSIGGITPGRFPATLQNVFYRLANDNKPVSTEQLSKSYGWSKK